jgi:hypothetical protein
MPPEETDSTISKREMVKLRARANLLFALLSQSNQDIERQRMELQSRDSDLGQLRAELQSRDSDLSQLRTELQSRESDLAHVHEEIRQIVNSRSWRVTRPLRALSRLIGR